VTDSDRFEQRSAQVWRSRVTSSCGDDASNEQCGPDHEEANAEKSRRQEDADTDEGGCRGV
jgi:hypothetical protein